MGFRPPIQDPRVDALFKRVGDLELSRDAVVRRVKALEDRADAAETLSLLRDIRTNVARVYAQGAQIMATVEQYASALSRVDTAITQIGTGIATLLERLNQPGLTPEQEEAILGQIGERAALLEQIAVSVTNPVPVPIPPIEPVQ